MKHLKNFFLFSILLTASSIAALAQDSGCSSGVKVPQDLASQLLRQAFKSMEMPQDEQDKITRDAKKRKGGVATLFCAEAVDLD